MNRNFLRINSKFAKFVKILEKKNWTGGFFVFRGGVGGAPPSKTTTGQVGIFPEEYNPIGSIVTEILRDGRKDRHQATLYYRYTLHPNHFTITLS